MKLNQCQRFHNYNYVYILQAPSIPLKIEKQPARKGNVISIRAKGVRPLTYEWFLDNKPLTVCDDQNYGGLTTDKLEILDNISLARGVFKCRVKDKVNPSEESDELGKRYHNVLCILYSRKFVRCKISRFSMAEQLSETHALVFHVQTCWWVWFPGLNREYYNCEHF